MNAYNAVSKALYGVSFEDSASPQQGTELFVQETGKRRVVLEIVPVTAVLLIFGIPRQNLLETRAPTIPDVGFVVLERYCTPRGD